MEKTEIKNKKDIKELLYNYFLIFIIASFIGWVYEGIFYKITENRLTNSGFFYGPYVPIYGIGAILIVVLLKRFKGKPVLFFVMCMLVTGILEYIVGIFMVSVWHRRWWDYTGLFMNIGGQVCLRSVVSFAIGSIPLIYFIEPKAIDINLKMSEKNKNIIYGSIALIMIIDAIICITVRNPIF